MFKNQNLRWALIVFIVLGATFVLYLNYERDDEEMSETSSQEVLSSGIESVEVTEESIELSSEDESESVTETGLDVDTTNQSQRIAVIPSQSSESSQDNESDETIQSEETRNADQASESKKESSASDGTSETDNEASSKSNQVSDSNASSSDEASQDDETKEAFLDTNLSFDDIYQVDLMTENGIKPLNLDDYKNMADVIDQTLAEFNVNSSEISLAYYNFHNEEHYYLNENEMITAASITKVPLSALYINLIESDKYSLDTELEYREALFERGAGNITNGPLQSSYTIEELITEAITHSDNTAMNILKAEYNREFGNFREDTLTFAGIDEKSEAYLTSNVSSAYIMEQILIKISQDETYNALIDLMFETSPTQLFTTYVNNEMMANKFGRYEQSVNDNGIYYENNQPQYILVILTDDISQADQFLEVMNLRVNQWFRAQYQ